MDKFSAKYLNIYIIEKFTNRYGWFGKKVFMVLKSNLENSRSENYYWLLSQVIRKVEEDDFYI